MRQDSYRQQSHSLHISDSSLQQLHTMYGVSQWPAEKLVCKHLFKECIITNIYKGLIKVVSATLMWHCLTFQHLTMQHFFFFNVDFLVCNFLGFLVFCCCFFLKQTLKKQTFHWYWLSHRSSVELYPLYCQHRPLLHELMGYPVAGVVCYPLYGPSHTLCEWFSQAFAGKQKNVKFQESWVQF